MRMLEEKQGLRNQEMTSSKVLNENPEYGHYEGQSVGSPQPQKLNYKL